MINENNKNNNEHNKNNKIINSIDDFNSLLGTIRKLIEGHRVVTDTPFIIAIDGRAASGKTTLAERLKAELRDPVSIIHMDDFFLPLEKRTLERLNEPGGNVDYERFNLEVIDKLKLKAPFSYQRFDCGAKSLKDFVQIDASPNSIIIIEGSYSHHPYFGDYADLKIFKSVPSDVQWERILKRNGPTWAEDFRNKWIPMEENYFTAFSIEAKADMVLDV